MGLFSRKEYVFLTFQDKIADLDKSKDLNQQLQDKIKSSLKRKLFGRRYIRYADFFTNKKTLQTYTVLTTFEPRKYRKFLPLIYEIYAFTETGDSRVFQDYKTEEFEYSNEFQTIRMIKITL